MLTKNRNNKKLFQDLRKKVNTLKEQYNTEAAKRNLLTQREDNDIKKKLLDTNANLMQQQYQMEDVTKTAHNITGT